MSPSIEPSERRLAAQIAAYTSWGNTADRSARTHAARAARDAKFLEQAGGDPIRAEYLRKAYFARLALASATSRRRAKQLTARAEVAEAELAAESGGDPSEAA